MEFKKIKETLEELYSEKIIIEEKIEKFENLGLKLIQKGCGKSIGENPHSELGYHLLCDGVKLCNGKLRLCKKCTERLEAFF